MNTRWWTACVGWGILALTLALGCRDGVAPSSTGSIEVRVATGGADLDPDGYTVALDSAAVQVPVSINGRNTTFSDVAPGQHTLEITGLAPNCTVSGLTTLTVTVAAGATVRVAFAVSCAAFGAVRVTATTGGADLDPDGYSVVVEGQSAQALPPNGGTVTFYQVVPGPRLVTLGGVQGNCTVPGSLQVTVTVPPAATAAIAFDLTCVQIMPTGSAIAFVRNSGGNREVFLVTGGSVPLDLTNNAGADGPAVWSPDGTKIAFVSDRDGNAEIYVMSPDGSGQLNLTGNGATESSPAWSPDGSRIAFVSNRDGNDEVYVMQADGTGQVNLTSSPTADWSPAWEPDASTIAFVSDRDGNQEIYRMNADGSEPVNVSNNAARDRGPVWSADGMRIAFVSDRDGNAEIYLMNPDGTGQINLTNSPATDGSPAWSPDGRRIAFASGGIAVINVDGTGFAKLITDHVGGCTPSPGAGSTRISSGPVWSPDGSRIAYYWASYQRSRASMCRPMNARSGISVINPEGSAAVALVDDPGVGNGSPAWRPL